MKSFAALTALLALVAASPVEVAHADEGALEKRDTEIIYLANCQYNGKDTSHIFYYPESWQGSSGEGPSNDNHCQVTNDNYVFWENGAHQCTFPTGVTFTTHIDWDAQDRPDFTWAGWGSNGYKNWDCYKDNYRQIFAEVGTGRSHTCNSVYYCTPQ